MARFVIAIVVFALLSLFSVRAEQVRRQDHGVESVQLAATPAPKYTFVQSIVFTGSTCGADGGQFSATINGTTVSSCTQSTKVGNVVADNICKPFQTLASTPTTPYSSLVKCVTNNTPFSKVGTGLFSYLGPKDKCNTLTGSTSWTFMLQGACNVRTAGSAYSSRLVSCDPVKGWVKNYYMSPNCMGPIATVKKGMPSNSVCTASKTNKGQFEGNFCVVAPKGP